MRLLVQKIYPASRRKAALSFRPFSCPFPRVKIRIGQGQIEGRRAKVISKQHMNHISFPLSFVLSLIAFFLVAFGQPAWLPWNGLIAGACGFALFWRVLLSYPLWWQRFYLATAWFTGVQLVQLSWFTSHPYWYIYAVYFLLSLGVGIQFGLLSLLIRPEKFTSSKTLYSLWNFLLIAAVWVFLEWIRLFALSGLSWNPVGLSLTSHIYALQTASLAGIFGLSFWVILVNLLALWAWMQKAVIPASLWLSAVATPYLYGAIHLFLHSPTTPTQHLRAVLVQTAFAPEESNVQQKNLVSFVTSEWKQILTLLKKHQGKSIHLIVLPEFVVPFGTYSDVYPLASVHQMFLEVFGEDSLHSLPDPSLPFASVQPTATGLQWFVNNAYWTQSLANLFRSDILIGLEDAEDVAPHIREYYSAAIFIHPQQVGQRSELFAKRYAKRILVPMGEYIPFEACRKLAQRYGVFGSFTCGKEAIVMHTHGIPFSPSICYEETFGGIIREGRQKGADLLVNLTSDVWYPDSKLPRQHLDHARVRTVENGVPLIRACNTGITAALDQFGQDIAILGGKNPEEMEWHADSLLVDIPIHSYPTLYTRFGDSLIIGFCLFLWLIEKCRFK